MNKITLKDNYTLSDLFEILKALRGENGCPWDKIQTHETLKKCLIEEAYEAIDAYDSGDDILFANELGDVLLQVAFHSQLAEERKAFDFDRVLFELCTKLITRHTHVFGDVEASDPQAALANWEKNKNKEHKDDTCYKVLNDVPHHLPSLMRAEKVQKKAAGFGAKVPDINKAIENIKKNLKEIKSDENAEQSYKELLFQVVALGRAMELTPETELTTFTGQFIEKCKVSEKDKNLSNISF